MSKALFFDIDGTLVSFKTHCIPESAVEALNRAKQCGHKIIISTGRPKCIINNLSQIEHLIDGYITTNGAFCFVDNHIIRQLSFSTIDATIILQDAKYKQYPTIVVNSDRLRVINGNSLVQQIFVEQLNIQNLDYNTPLDIVFSEPILQITSFIDTAYEQDLGRQLKNTTIGRWHPSFTDFTPIGANKGDGLTSIADYLNINIADTIAFGDGGNDIPMLQAAGIGVAMGNSALPTQKAANIVTTHIDDNGIANALTRLNII